MDDHGSGGNRRKKSSLSRLAAKHGKKSLMHSDDSSECEVAPSLSLRRQRISEERQQPYPIDAHVEVNNGSAASEDDSDEGIEVGTGSLLEASAGSSSSRTALNHRLMSLNVQGQQELDRHTLPALKSRQLGLKGEKRFRDQNSDGDDLVKGLGEMKSKKKQSIGDDLARTSRDTLRNKESGFRRSSGHYMDDMTHSDSDDPASGNKISTPRQSLSDTMSTSSKDDDEVVAQYRGILSHSPIRTMNNMQTCRSSPSKTMNTPHCNNDHLMEMKMQQSLQHPVPSSSSPVPHTRADSQVMDMSPACADRPWLRRDTSVCYDSMSQRSSQSSSVMAQITTKAVKARSYLVGSVSGGGCSLLGSDELDRYFPDRKLRVFTATWNMCESRQVPCSIDDVILPDSCHLVHDVYVIGTQESVTDRSGWQLKLQETLGPQLVLLHSATFGVLYLDVFIRRDLIWFCSVCEDASVSTRSGPSSVKTKGAVAVCFSLFGTSLLFINSHLSPHDGKTKDRIADYNKICSSLNLPKLAQANSYTDKDKDATARFDAVFWGGDLNFRILKERERVDDAVRGIESYDLPKYEDIIRHDELVKVRSEGLAFQNFQEGRIKFKPTYKFDVGTDKYDSSNKLRIPSYTDRILYRCKRKNTVACMQYDSVDSMKTSDHKPVFATFEVNLRPGRDNVPLAAGRFNRDVWLEANKKRAEQHTVGLLSEKGSRMCNIQ